MGNHIIDGEFQSDKYPTTPRGKVPLSIKDPTAQDLLWEYAQRRRAVDAEFSSDLETALRAKGYEGEQGGFLRVVHDVLLESSRVSGEDANALIIEIARRLRRGAEEAIADAAVPSGIMVHESEQYVPRGHDPRVSEPVPTVEIVIGTSRFICRCRDADHRREVSAKARASVALNGADLELLQVEVVRSKPIIDAARAWVRSVRDDDSPSEDTSSKLDDLQEAVDAYEF